MYNLGDLIDKTKNLEDLAIIDDCSSVTYNELLKLVDTVKNYLANKNIKKGDVVAIQDYNTINFVAIFLGILKSGATALPINDSLPKSMLDFILNDSKPSLILKNVPDLIVKEDKEIKQVSEKDSAFILYTSGSTGKPKGVVIPHSHKWNILERAKKSSKRKIIVAAPSYHMNGLSNIEFSLATHSTLVLMKKFDSKTFLSNILKHKVNTITSVPTMLHLMLDEIEILENNQFDFVKHIATASAPVNKQLFSRLKSFFPNATVTNNYGLTEVGPSLFGSHPTLPTPSVSVGYPRPGIEYRIVNNSLEIKSPSMLLGYKNIDSSNLTPDGFFITNDVFEIDANGFYFFMGRKDDMFTCGGHNVYPKEIEKIIEEYPGIELAVVIGIEDSYKGVKPYSFIWIKEQIKIEDLKKHLENRLPHYGCPRNIWVLDEIPLNSSKKIDINYLKKEALLRIKNSF
jgi:long-chain acyl-CoA synthetase